MTSIHHYGTFDVDNYGDLLFPKILEWRLTPHFIEHISPTNAKSIFIDSSPSRYSPTHKPIATITGGGNILHFRGTSLPFYSACSKMAYPRLVIEPAVIASEHKIPYIINSPSIASKTLNPLEKMILSRILESADYISFRDSRSADRAAALTKNIVNVVPDTAFDISRMWPELKREHEDPSGYAVFHINSRYGGAPEEIASAISNFSCKTKLSVVLLPIGPCHGDIEYSQQISKIASVPCEVFGNFELRGFAELLANAEIYIGSSMHGFITAASYSVPCALVLNKNYMAKFEGVLESLGLGNDRIFYSWESATADAFTLGAPNPEGLSEIFERLDVHWNTINSIINGVTKKKELSTSFIYSFFSVSSNMELGKRAFINHVKKVVPEFVKRAYK